ncbi:hypothetical protein [Brevibacillus choshinensis]|uniref:Uncharacterized protein n=1 Tax=Brevibacillus choshinensis TaxID=54911 RepID=A0ABX7FV89_BRECH|nr:hypothetical protein [Brevibacillus choshinensis]QRG70112.1 hypothetical protein JNE38_13925 [Brevibacillus choshinensis]
MEWKTVVKWLGMICLLAGLTRMGMTPSALIWGSDSPQELTFGFIACVLMSAGTIGTYLVQSRETGIAGFLATLLIIIGNIIITSMVWSVFALGSNVPDNPGVFVVVTRMIGMVGTMLGTLLFAIVTFRARVYPRWIVVLQVLMMCTIVLDEWFAFFWGLSYIGMGYLIWSGKLKNKITAAS